MCVFCIAFDIVFILGKLIPRKMFSEKGGLICVCFSLLFRYWCVTLIEYNRVV